MAAFDQDEMKKRMSNFLNQVSFIPSGKNGAFVVHADSSGVHTAVAFKTGSNWEISGDIGYHPLEGISGFEFGTSVVKSW